MSLPYSYENPNPFEALNAAGVRAVAARLGLEPAGPNALQPCPACGAEQRGGRDRRGPVGLRPDDLGWLCHRCKAGGDAAALALYAVCGCGPQEAARADWRALAAWARDGGLAAASGIPRTPRPTPRPKDPRRPPRGEVAALWDACLPVDEDFEVSDWLRGRGLKPDKVADCDLARAIPEGLSLPGWAACRGRSWHVGWRLVVPLYDAGGDVVTLHARAVRDLDPKGASPRGFQLAGTAMADPLARLTLQAGSTPAWWPADRHFRAVIVEGVPDWLSWSTLSGDADEYAPAVFGLAAGTWTPGIADRVPTGAAVYIATDSDAAGEGYASKVAATLAGRCGLKRLRPSGVAV